MTVLVHGQSPISVTAVTQTDKPATYPNVDDDATIILRYPNAQAVLMPSWNWPFDRKDMELYGATGYVITVASDDLRTRYQGEKSESQKPAPPLPEEPIQLPRLPRGSPSWRDQATRRPYFPRHQHHRHANSRRRPYLRQYRPHNRTQTATSIGKMKTYIALGLIALTIITSRAQNASHAIESRKPTSGPGSNDASHPTSASPQVPYRRAELPVENRINDLMRRMTLEEKVRQLDMYAGVPALMSQHSDSTHATADAVFLPDKAQAALGNAGRGLHS